MHTFSEYITEKNWLKAMSLERRMDAKIKGTNPLMSKAALGGLAAGSGYLAAKGIAHAAAGDMIGAGLSATALAGTLGSAAMMYKRHWPEVRRIKTHLDMIDAKKKRVNEEHLQEISNDLIARYLAKRINGGFVDLRKNRKGKLAPDEKIRLIDKEKTQRQSMNKAWGKLYSRLPTKQADAMVKKYRKESADDDYKGQHQAPGPEDGSPMYDVTQKGTYPKDFYSSKGFQYYSDTGSPHDAESHSIVHSYHGRPNRPITVYRAIPKDAPKGTKINPGDWVTPSRSYAHDHGHHSLGGKGKYKVLSMQVKARDLHTDGNSIHEWGYHPVEFKGMDHEREEKAKAKALRDSLTEARKTSGYKTHHDVTDSYRGDNYGSVTAHSGEVDLKKPAGTLSYAGNKWALRIGRVSVDPEHRGKGVATDMAKALRQDYPKAKINWGMTEGPEGTAFVKKMKRTLRIRRGSIKESQDTEYMYHGTNEDGLYGIQDDGHLKVHRPWHGTDQRAWPDGKTEKRSYWHHDPKVIDSFYPTEGKPVLIRAKRSEHQFEQESANSGDHYCRKPINREKLEYLDNGIWKKV